MSKRSLFSPLVMLSILAVSAAAVSAQVTTVTIHGTVSDATGAVIPDAQITAVNILSRMETVVSGEGLMSRRNPARPMAREDLPAVAIFDREVFGADRRLTLEWIFDGAPEYAWVIEERGRVIGYTFGRHGFNFEHLGPVVAHDQQAARQMVSACLR